MNNLEIIDMKTLLSLAFLCIIFTGCEKDWKEEAPLNNIHLEERDIYDGLYENYGIKLSEKDSINYFEIFENNGDILLSVQDINMPGWQDSTQMAMKNIQRK
ncbi:MAG: hypothetical protein LBR49_05140 [Tannerella sp.]|jgi:hypothetical protein|nr:hypothetical protein [Tannerella sp.]